MMPTERRKIVKHMTEQYLEYHVKFVKPMTDNYLEYHGKFVKHDGKLFRVSWRIR